MAKTTAPPASPVAPPPKYEAKRGYYQIDQDLYPWSAEMYGFRWGLNPPRGIGRYEHLVKYLKWFWPQEACSPQRPCKPCRAAGKMTHPLKWNPWTERTLKELCDDNSAVM